MFKTSKRRFVNFALVLILSLALFAGYARDDEASSDWELGY